MKVTPTKLIRDAFHDCNPTGNYRNENAGWPYQARFPEGKDAWIACEGNGSKLTLSGNRMNQIHNRNRQSINGLIYVNNADFDCSITEFYACAANCSKGLCITFEGSGTHSITGSRFNYCGMKWTSDGSVIYIGGNSQNNFNDVKFDTTGNGNSNPQKWEIAPTRALRICNQSNLLYNQMHCYNHTSDTGGGFLKMETTGYVNITGGNIHFCCDRLSDPKAAVYKVSTGFLKLESLNINGCGFQEGQTGATTLWMENSNIEIINCEIRFDSRFAAKACVGLKVIRKGYIRINSNKFIACQRGVIYLGQEGGEEDAEIKDNHFNQLTQAVEGCAIEAYLWNESTVFTGNRFNELPPNVPAVKIVFQGTLSKDNYTVSNQEFTGFRTSGNGNAFLISTVENKPVVFNNCF
ncbi:hypothetical protein TRFO_15085 [Tritrichomonas foetus]|uniref:Right handed beta helix domain-containing protein n=1 Tax=Tritrichomonas foetus TaxID=1144522 RepID=A0A1J4KTS8_9EUKA|nr:hypothetical protein TRFO_15085 [Tritrichomonas foetus]|eukprot:OHT14546.1 hypothetical protein TRFO_15085 [Tritrichomonas foetus]